MGIITEGLNRYYHFTQGINGNIWENIAPDYKSTSNATLVGAATSQNGIVTDGVDDYVNIPVLPFTSNNITIECVVIPSVQNGTGSTAIISAGLATELSFNNEGVYSYVGANTSIGRSAGTRLINGDIRYNNPVYLAFTINTLTDEQNIIVNENISIFPYTSGTISSSTYAWKNKTLSLGRRGASNFYFFKGTYSFVRIYDRALTDAEIANNRAMGTSVGLSDVGNVDVPPNVTLISTNRNKLSSNSDFNQSITKVKFNVDVTEYVARLNGVSPTTGTLVHQGGAVPANTEVDIIVDWNELTTEGLNRINIYGKSSNGSWTQYEN